MTTPHRWAGWALIFSLLPILPAHADRVKEYGAFLGDIVPGGPDGNEEIIGIGGGRFGISSGEALTYEAGFLTGAQAPVIWRNFFADMRFDIPVQDILPHVGVGLDVIHFQTKIAQFDDDNHPILDASGNQYYREINKILIGAHVLGGIQTHLVGPAWLRADMKLNIIPALILTIGVGLEFRLGEAKPGA